MNVRTAFPPPSTQPIPATKILPPGGNLVAFIGGPSAPKWTPQQTKAVEQILQQMIDGSLNTQQADDAIRVATAASASRASWITKALPLIKWGAMGIGVAADLLLNAEPGAGSAELRAERNISFNRMRDEPSNLNRDMEMLGNLIPNEDIRRGMRTLHSKFLVAMNSAKSGNPAGLPTATAILTAIYQFHLGPPTAAAQALIAQIVSNYAKYVGIPPSVQPTPGGQRNPATPAPNPNTVGPGVVGPGVKQFTADELNDRMRRFAATFNGQGPSNEFHYQQVSPRGRFETVPLQETNTLVKAQQIAVNHNNKSSNRQSVAIPVPVDYWDQVSGQHVQSVLTFTGLAPRVVLEKFNDYLVWLDRTKSFNVRGNLESILKGAGLSVDGLRSRAQQGSEAEFASAVPGRKALSGDAARYDADKHTIRSFNKTRLSEGLIDKISLIVPADNSRHYFLQNITRGQAASLLQSAVDNGELRNGTSAQAVIDANGLGSLLGIGSNGRVTVKSPPATSAVQASSPPLTDDEFSRRVLPHLNPTEQEEWRRYAENYPSIVTIVREAGHDATEGERVEAARALIRGAYGQDVVAWLRAGGLASGRLPPGAPPRGTTAAAAASDPAPETQSSPEPKLTDPKSVNRPKVDALLEKLPHMTTNGQTVIAIPDTHGVPELVPKAMAWLRENRPEVFGNNTVVVNLGDSLDKGPDSAKGIQELIDLRNDPGISKVFDLMGNHELWLTEFMKHPEKMKYVHDWLTKRGGRSALESYARFAKERPDISSFSLDGLDLNDIPAEKRVGPKGKEYYVPDNSTGFYTRLHEQIVKGMPEEHLKFLMELRNNLSIGDYYFAHAGVDPAKPLGAETRGINTWVRDKYLEHEGPWLGSPDSIVVTGHSILKRPLIEPNKFATDLGSFKTGDFMLTVIKDGDVHFLILRKDTEPVWLTPREGFDRGLFDDKFDPINRIGN